MNKVYILFDMNYGFIQDEAYLNKLKAGEKLLELKNEETLKYDERYKWTVLELKLNEEEAEVKPLKVEAGGKAKGTEIRVDMINRRENKWKYRFLKNRKDEC